MEKKQGKNNTVNLLKYIAAWLVICSHAHGLSNKSLDLSEKIFNGVISEGAIAVTIFFAFSGFFLTKSIQKSSGAGVYFKNRLKRLLPQLWIVILITVFVLGPIMTNLSLDSYFLNKSTYLYLANMFLLPVHNLPGVFENCKRMSTVNGALWTLPVEFICYVALFVIFKIKLLRKKYIWISVPMMAVAYIGVKFVGIGILIEMIGPMVSFLTGVFLMIYKGKIFDELKKYNWLIVVVSLVCLFTVGRFYSGIFYVLVPLICVTISQLISVGFAVEILGSASYGMYLVAFPIQQTLISCSGGEMNPYVNMLIAGCIATVLGIILGKLEKIFIK